MAALDLDALGFRLLLDLVAIALLAGALSYRRHRRRDLVALYVVFNVGLFAAVVVIAAGQVGVAVGFGLFAVLSIIRLRGEPLSNPEIAYFFAAIVLGLVTAVDLGSLALTAALAGLVLIAAAVVDRPSDRTATRRMEVWLEVVFADTAALRSHLEERLCMRVVELNVLELDYVRETTRVAVRVQTDPGTGTDPPVRGGADGAIVSLPR